MCDIRQGYDAFQANTLTFYHDIWLCTSVCWQRVELCSVSCTETWNLPYNLMSFLLYFLVSLSVTFVYIMWLFFLIVTLSDPEATSDTILLTFTWLLTAPVTCFCLITPLYLTGPFNSNHLQGFDAFLCNVERSFHANNFMFMISAVVRNL